jgi:hypothetical protein
MLDHRQSRTFSIMKIIIRAVLSCAALAFAATSQAAPIPGPSNDCASVVWNPPFLKELPKAAAACRDVTVKDGVKYAQFDGTVAKVGKHYVQVAVSDVANIPISMIAFEIGDGGSITLNGKKENVADLKVGDQLTFWVHEGEFGVMPTLTDKTMRILKPDAMPAN